jgi:hypothetical protein
MHVLSGLRKYSPNGAHSVKPAFVYIARAGANAVMDPVSRLTRRKPRSRAAPRR